MLLQHPTREWLETDGLGGFASGTASTLRTRREHALLTVACAPPSALVSLIQAVEVWICCGEAREALSSHAYHPEQVHPDGLSRLAGFEAEPWPRWTFNVLGCGTLTQELFMPRGAPLSVLTFRAEGMQGAQLRVRPLVAAREPWALQRENPQLDFTAHEDQRGIRLQPYAAHPGLILRSNGRFGPAADWYRGFRYADGASEDLASFGELCFDLADEAFLVLAADLPEANRFLGPSPAAAVRQLREAELSRRRTSAPLQLASESYLAKRGRGLTVISGFPGHGERARDAMVYLREVSLPFGRLDEARAILLEWSELLSGGVLSDRPAAGPAAPSPDGALWFALALHDFLGAQSRTGRRITEGGRARLLGALGEVLEATLRGTRHGLRAMPDGLVSWSPPGRESAKPLGINLLWLNALAVGSAHSVRFRPHLERARRSLRERFWDESRGRFLARIDCGSEGRTDSTSVASQILSVAGLPFPTLEPARARRVVAAVESLWTPAGLLSASGPGPCEAATLGSEALSPLVSATFCCAFLEAWIAVRGSDPSARAQARERFLVPLREQLGRSGLLHLPEAADATPPHAPRGNPFQAAPTAALLRLEKLLL